MEPPASPSLLPSEAALYDRQLRIWGVSGQRSLKALRCVVVGSNHLSAEVSKNLVLAGVGTLVLVPVGQETDTILGRNSSEMISTLTRMNSHVDILVENDVDRCCETPSVVFLCWDVNPFPRLATNQYFLLSTGLKPSQNHGGEGIPFATISTNCGGPVQAVPDDAVVSSFVAATAVHKLLDSLSRDEQDDGTFPESTWEWTMGLAGQARVRRKGGEMAIVL